MLVLILCYMCSVTAMASKQEAVRSSVKKKKTVWEMSTVKVSEDFAMLTCLHSVRTCQHKTVFETLIIILFRKDSSEGLLIYRCKFLFLIHDPVLSHKMLILLIFL